jgi:hypothetical protein
MDKLTTNQKMIAGAVLTAVLVVVFQLFVAFAIPVNVPPVPTAPAQLGAAMRNGIICNGSEEYCVDSRAKGIVVYSDQAGATPVFKVDGTTGDLTVNGSITATTIVSQAVGFTTTGNGTAAVPAYTFASDSDTGLYRVGANDIGITTNGVLALDASATAVTAALPVVHAAGTVSLPSVTFASDLDSGLYRIGANNIGLATNGAKVFDCSATTCTTTALMKGPAEGSVLINARSELTVTQLVNGATIVTVPTGKAIRLVSAEATATGATCTTATSVDLVVGANHLVVFTVANLVRSTLLRAGVTTGTTVLADGASFTTQAATTNMTAIGVTGTLAGCTSVIFNISYVLE